MPSGEQKLIEVVKQLFLSMPSTSFLHFLIDKFSKRSRNSLTHLKMISWILTWKPSHSLYIRPQDLAGVAVTSLSKVVMWSSHSVNTLKESLMWWARLPPDDNQHTSFLCAQTLDHSAFKKQTWWAVKDRRFYVEIALVSRYWSWIEFHKRLDLKKRESKIKDNYPRVACSLPRRKEGSSWW